MKFQWIILTLALLAGLLTRYIVDSNEPTAAVPGHPINLLASEQQAVPAVIRLSSNAGVA